MLTSIVSQIGIARHATFLSVPSAAGQRRLWKGFCLISRSQIQWWGMLSGPVAALLIYLLLPDSYTTAADKWVPLTQAGRATAAIGIWMAIWWLTEAIPVYATALLPLALFPLTGAATIEETASRYGDDLIFLFMGGFILALAMEKWGLHKRIAFSALTLVGSDPRRIIGAFMLITAFISMFVMNTSTTIMMLPIAVSIIGLLGFRGRDNEGPEQTKATHDEARNFSLCLLLGIAYAASIGGIGTKIGTAPNGILLAFIKDRLGIDISFAQWMAIGVPVVLAFLPLAWLVLTRLIFPLKSARLEGSEALIRNAHAALGKIDRGEVLTLFVFLFAAVFWIARPVLVEITLAGYQPFGGVTDAGIAIVAALCLFAIPVDIRRREFVMDWETAVRLPWGVLVLFGGGLSLAAAVDNNGVSEFLGSLSSQLTGLPAVAIILLVVAMLIFLTELTSNTATTATLIPVLAAVAPGLGLDPLVLIVPAGIAASCAFMLPVATPPNAIVFGTGLVRIPEMSRAGIWLNLIGIVLITTLMYLVAMPLLGVKVAVLAGGGG